MINITFLIKPSEITKENLCVIYCRFQTTNTLKKEKSTKIFVTPEQWDQQNQKILTPKGISKLQREQIEAQNETLLSLSNKIRTIYNSLSYSGKTNITANDIKIELEGKHKDKTLEDALNEYQKEFDKQQSQYKKISRLKIITELFLLDLYKKQKIFLYELSETEDFPEKFGKYVSQSGNKREIAWAPSYISKMNGFLFRAIEKARKSKWCDKNIFEGHKTKDKDMVSTPKIPLSREELNKIKDTKFESKSLQRYADIFVFQCLTSLRYSDVLALEYNHIQTANNGKYIEKNAEKTKNKILVPLIKEAEDLLNKYKDDIHTRIHHQNKCFPVKSNGNYNKRLKVIADICQIQKHLSTHVARYTCNQLMFEKGISDEKRRQVLGHTNVKMTEHYTTKDINFLIDEMNKI